jgi:hypothetical protein
MHVYLHRFRPFPRIPLFLHLLTLLSHPLSHQPQVAVVVSSSHEELMMTVHAVQLHTLPHRCPLHTLPHRCPHHIQPHRCQHPNPQSHQVKHLQSRLHHFHHSNLLLHLLFPPCQHHLSCLHMLQVQPQLINHQHVQPHFIAVRFTLSVQ